MRRQRRAHRGDRAPRPAGDSLRVAIDAAERATRGGERLLLRLAIDYSARDAILAAAERLGELPVAEQERRQAFGRLVSSQSCECRAVQDVDLIIRTGGECRLSDFLLWEGAYAELYFTEVMWPDFGRSELRAAISEFHGRERRFGSVPGGCPGAGGSARGQGGHRGDSDRGRCRRGLNTAAGKASGGDPAGR